MIASVTEPFCSTCNRARQTAEGKIYTCLFATEGYDLRNLIRSGVDDAQLTEAVRKLWQKRNDRYSELRSEETRNWPKIEMSYVGG